MVGGVGGSGMVDDSGCVVMREDGESGAWVMVE